jgi:pimeloyl-ACP methyl ester carboxylesterase
MHHTSRFWAFLVLVAIACSWSAAASAAEPAAGAASRLPAGRQVSIGGGRTMFLRCAGTGSPTVVLDAGIHDSSDTWNLTQTEPPVPSSPSVFLGIARFTRVCEYDRPGTLRYTDPPAITTRSTPVDNPRTLTGQADDLESLLTKGHVPGPYLLVAHSYGGMIARRFTQLHPRSVRGIVFVDAFSPSIKPLFGDLWKDYEQLLNHPGLALDQDPKWETVDADEAVATLDAGPAMPDIPIVALSKTEPFATAPGVPVDLTTRLEAVWPAVQQSIVDLRPLTPHVLATGSDHYVQINDPDLVISATRLVRGRIAAANR